MHKCQAKVLGIHKSQFLKYSVQYFSRESLLECSRAKSLGESGWCPK